MPSSVASDAAPGLVTAEPAGTVEAVATPAYDAFISYSHAKDKALAAALQSAMQRLGKPWYRRRALRLFRDDTALTASPHLWPDIEKALGQSRYLILLASPEAAASPWVDKEVATWLEHNGTDTVLIALTDGELEWNARRGDFRWSKAMPLPPSLKHCFADEPRWIDLRPYREGASPRDARFADLAADFAAALHGLPKDDLLSQEVRQQRRVLRLAGVAVTLLGILLGLAGWQWRVANIQTVEARVQRNEARLQRNNVLAQLAAVEELRGNLESALRLAVYAARLDQLASPRTPRLSGAELAAATMKTEWLLVLSGHEDGVRSAAFSRDGSRVITASDDHTARIWNSATGQVIQVLPHDGIVMSANFSPDGQHMVTAALNKAYIWSASSADPIAVLQGHGDKVRSAAFSPDSLHVVTASEDGTARVWDARTGQNTAVLQGHAAPVVSAVYNVDGTRIVTASSDGTARIWDADAAKELATFRGPPVPVFSATISRDSSRILTVSGDNAARIWDTATATVVSTLRGHEGLMSFGAFSPDGTWAVTAASDGTALIWDVANGKEIRALRGQQSGLSTAAFSPDGAQIVIASWDRTVRIWDATAGLTPSPIGRGAGELRSAAYSADGLYVVTVTTDHAVDVWSTAATPSKVTPSKVTLQSNARFAAISRDGSKIVVTDEDGTVTVWDRASAAKLYTSPSGTFSQFATFSPDEKLIVTISNGAAVIWDAALTGPITVLRNEHGPITAAAVSPDGSRIVTGAMNSEISVWDAHTGRELATQLFSRTRRVNSVAFSPDGSRIVTASLDKVVRVLDGATVQEIIAARGHDGDVRSASFNADGSRIVSASVDGTVRVWDASTGKEIVSLQVGAPVAVAALSPDDKGILIAADGSSPQRWDILFALMPTKDLIKEVCTRQLVGRTLLTEDEMRLAGYPAAATPGLDVCTETVISNN
jgi:WD40 repeat protein